VFVETELPLDLWHQGVRYEVFIHMPLIEDYSRTANNLQAAIDNLAVFTLILHSYDWRYGLIVSSPPTSQVTRFLVKLPRPPQERDGWEEG
jgi:hypothetical protein